MHKYFARRPHNQFREVIEHYVPEDGLVLDCFGGGGVTLIEGLSTNRRVISVDTNEIACLVQNIEVNEPTLEEIDDAWIFLQQSVTDLAKSWFLTDCDSCGRDANVRWFERAYVVNCPSCQALTELSNQNKTRNESGRQVNGKYTCSECGCAFASVAVKRVGSRILSVRYRCGDCGIQHSRPPIQRDLDIEADVFRCEERHISDHQLEVPTHVIPTTWDRQSEDALLRKGFERFADLFSTRNRLVLAEFISALGRYTYVSIEAQTTALGLVSALIRYVNSMTFSTSSWMDGRPVAWAKHAYWLPNQYVEVNPFEYLDHRHLAFRRAWTDRANRFTGKRRANQVFDVVTGDADYAIVCGDSRSVDLPDSCVDAVITDPPYGSNVQYGELTHLWSTWLKGLNPFHKSLFSLDDEILVHRKKHDKQKRFEDYTAGLTDVFREMYRLIKPGGVLVFTFNNSNSHAWYSVVKSAVDAGFMIEREGMQYLDPIHAYRDTAHLRFDGEVQGDVLYTFVKIADPANSGSDLVNLLGSYSSEKSLEVSVDHRVDHHLRTVIEATLMIARGCPEPEVINFLNSGTTTEGLLGSTDDEFN